MYTKSANVSMKVHTIPSLLEFTQRTAPMDNDWRCDCKADMIPDQQQSTTIVGPSTFILLEIHRLIFNFENDKTTRVSILVECTDKITIGAHSYVLEAFIVLY